MAADVLNTDRACGHGRGECRAQQFWPIVLEQFEQLLDFLDPGAGTPVSDLGQVLQGRLADLEQLLALEVALSTGAGGGRDQGGAVLGQR